MVLWAYDHKRRPFLGLQDLVLFDYWVSILLQVKLLILLHILLTKLKQLPTSTIHIRHSPKMTAGSYDH